MILIERFLKFAAQGMAFFIVAVFMFNELTSFLQILGLLTKSSMYQVSLASILFAVNNMFSKSFFGIDLVKN